MTNNLERRLSEHNQGKTKSNKSYAPFELVYFEEVEDSLQARKRELYLKGGNGRKWFKNQLKGKN